MTQWKKREYNDAANSTSVPAAYRLELKTAFFHVIVKVKSIFETHGDHWRRIQWRVNAFVRKHVSVKRAHPQAKILVPNHHVCVHTYSVRHDNGAA